MAVGRFRKKPVEIAALQWTGDNVDECFDFLMEHNGAFSVPDRVAADRAIEIETLEGTMRADVLDWIVKGVKDEFYPCKPDIFEASYDPVTD